MFVKANKSLGAFVTSADYTHSLCVRDRGQMHRLYGFASYGAALAAYEAITTEYNVGDVFAVRSMFDLNIEVGLRSDQWVEGVAPFRIVANAVAAYLRKEERETVKWALKTAERTGTMTFEQIVAHATQSLKERGFTTERWRVTDTLKSMVTIGRCHSHGNGRSGYFFARSTKARLADTRCPECGAHLAQTTLALQGSFRMILNPVETYFDKSLDLLPGETNADAEARHDRLHAAIAEEQGLYTGKGDSRQALDNGGW
jgi:hypothetical protein